MIGPRRATLTGRGAELAALGEAADSARGGSGGLVLVSGEAGVGKSRLCREFVASIHDAMHLRGQAYAGDRVVANAILVDTLRSARRDPTCPVWPAARQRAALLGTIVPELLDDSGGSAAADETYIFETVLDVVEDAAGERLAVWLAEDVQWADPATWRFLHYCARRAASMRLVVLATFRDDETLPDDPYWTRLAVLGARDGLARLRLPRLCPADTERIARELCGTEGDDDLVREIVERSGGTPLLVEELAAMSVAVGTEPDGVPEVVRATARERSRIAGDQARELLELAAVMGHDADLEVLVELRPDQAPAIEPLVTAGLLRPLGDEGGRGSVAFRHPLLREAIYADITWERRRKLHADAAEALTVHGSMQSVERVAQHWELAGQPEEALAALVAVIGQARRQGNFHRSVSLGRQALQLVERHRRLLGARPTLAEQLIDDLVAQGQWEELMPLLLPAWEAAAPGSPRRGRLTAFRAFAGWSLQTPIPTLISMLEAELARQLDGETQEVALLSIAMAMMLHSAGDLVRSQAAAERGLRIAVGCDDLDSESRARSLLTWLRLFDVRERRACVTDLRDIARRLRAAGLFVREASILLQVARITLDESDIQSAVAVGHTWNPWCEMGARSLRAHIAAFAGRHAEAGAIVEDVAQRLGEEGQAGWYFNAVRTTAAVMQGHVDDARRFQDRLEVRLRSGTVTESGDNQALLGWRRWEEGDLDGAVAALGDAVERAPTLRWEPGFCGPYVVPLYVDALLRTGQARRAEDVLRDVVARERDPDMDRYTAAGLAAAELRLHPSPDRLRAALEACAAADWPWLAGLSSCWAAELVGDRSAARAARDTWQRVGYLPGVARAERLVADLDRAAGGAGRLLTAREETVAALIAEGLTNAQIGEHLGISPVTVAHHVSSVLDKLGVASRTQVAVLLARGEAAR